MDDPRRPPLDEDTKRLIVAQALKSTAIPTEQLVRLFDAYRVEPVWEEMLLPWQRNLRECRDWFEGYRQGLNHQYSPSQHSPYPRQDTPSNPNKRKSGPELESAPGGSGSKRRSTTGVEGKPSAQHTNIAPKPPSNSASPIGASFPSASTVPPPKRRGRPPKALVEERQRQQIERGEVIAPMVTGAQAGPIQHSPPRESYNLPGFATIAPRSPAPAPSGSPRRGGNMHDAPSQRRQKSPKIPKRIPPLGPGEYTFNANPQPGGREEYTPPVPRESMQAGPIAPATSISQITHPVDPPKQSPAEPTPPKPGLDP